MIWVMAPMILLLAFAAAALFLGHPFFAGAALAAAVVMTPAVSVGRK